MNTEKLKKLGKFVGPKNALECFNTLENEGFAAGHLGLNVEEVEGGGVV